jgi:protein-S-isoprenylcysteine O-methyltransferase Ste14
MRLRASMPLLLTILGGAALGGLALRRLAFHEQGIGRILGVVALAAYAGWLAWESRVSARETQRVDSAADKSTMELAALAKISTLVGAFAGGGPIDQNLALIGLALLVPGVLLRASAIVALGTSYSHRIRPPEGVCARGPYRLLRHPAYLGTLVAHTGFVLVFFNVWSLLGLILLWLPAVLLRTIAEDRFLHGFLDYRAYARRVPARLFPGLW